MTTSFDLPAPSSALVIAAHPDDAEFQCGATLAKWAAAGATIHHLICTDGSKGTWDPNANVAELVAIREVEQRVAAAALGARGEVIFLGCVDGELANDPETRESVVDHIRRLRPQVVLTHDPWKRYRLHPDHRHAGQLALDACVAARDPFFFAHQTHPHHRPQMLLLFEADEFNHAENVDGYVGVKAMALLCHESQFVTTHGITDANDSTQIAGFKEKIASRAAEAGTQVGLAAVELFHRMSL